MNGYAGAAQNNLSSMQGISGPATDAPERPTIRNQTKRMASQVDQLREMCARAETIADQAGGSRPEKGDASNKPQAVANGAVDHLIEVSAEFGANLTRLELALNRIADAI